MIRLKSEQKRKAAAKAKGDDCKRFVLRSSSIPRAVICKKWVRPLKVLVLVSLALNGGYTVLHYQTMKSLDAFLVLTHLVLSWVIINECRRSTAYHKIIEEYSRKL